MIKNILSKLNLSKSNLDILISFSRYLSSGGVSKLIGVLALPLYAVLMTPEDYGRVSLFISYLGLATVVFHLNLSGAVKNNFLKSNLLGFETLKLSIRFIILIWLALSILFFLIVDLDERLNFPVNIYIFISAVFFSILKVTYFSVLLGLNNSKLYSSNTVLLSILELCFSLFFLWIIPDKFVARLIAIILPNTAVLYPIFSLYKRISKKNSTLSEDSKNLKSLLLFSLPLIPHQLGHLFLSQIDRIQLNTEYDNSEVGIYSFAYSIAILPQMFVLAYNNSTLKSLYSELNSNKNFKNILRRDNYFGAAIFSFIIFEYIVAPFVFKHLVPGDYVESLKFVKILIWLPFIYWGYLSHVNILFNENRTLIIAFATVFCASLNFFWNNELLNENSLYAAYTTIWCYSLLALFQAIFVLVIKKNTMYVNWFTLLIIGLINIYLGCF